MLVAGIGLANACLADINDLKVTEVMYHARDSSTISDENFDFIELKNTGTTAIDMSSVAFVDGISYSFGATMLAPGAFVVLVAMPANFAMRYPSVSYDGQYTGILRNSGERLKLVNGTDTIISFRFNDNLPWPVLADGNGWSLVVNEAGISSDPDDSDYWRASTNVYGSPGADDPAAVNWPAIYVNELLTHTDLPNVDAVELYNASGSTVDIGNWYLSDNRTTPKLYQIPDGTMLAAGDYYTVEETTFNSGPNPFSFNRSGEWVFLFSADAQGTLTGYTHGWEYEASFNPVSFGLYQNSVGDLHFVAQSSNTIGAVNAGPKVGPLVFTKIMYHPASGTQEFCALRNISSETQDLWSWQSADTTWRVTGIGFEFPPSTSVAAGETVYLTNHNPEVFRTDHSLGLSTQIFQFTGSLNNDGEFLGLYAPDNFDTTNTGQVWAPQVRIDAVRFNDAAPWPTGADGGGDYLQRIDANSYGNDPAAWQNSSEPVGIAAPLAIQHVSAYPNPAQSLINLSWEASAGTAQVLVTDISGRTVVQQTVHGNRCRLNVDALNSGVYFFVVQQNSARQTGKFVVNSRD